MADRLSRDSGAVAFAAAAGLPGMSAGSLIQSADGFIPWKTIGDFMLAGGLIVRVATLVRGHGPGKGRIPRLIPDRELGVT